MKRSSKTLERFSLAIPPLLLLSVVVLAVVAVLAGCGGGEAAPQRLAAVTDTVDGVERLSYPETAAPELAWAFDTTALIGGYTVDDPDYQFGRLQPQWLASDGAGNLYVFDSDGIRILGYGPDGDLIGRWGREGEGPGEIGGGFGVGSIAMAPGDTLWLADRPNQRFTLLPVAEEDAEPVSIPLTEDTESFTMVRELVVDSAGPIGQVSSFSFDREAETRPPETLVRFHRQPDGLGRDTIWSAPPRAMKIVEISSGQNQMIMLNQRQFDPELSWIRFSDGGLAVQDGAEYEIHLVDGVGETRRIIRRDPPPRLTTDEDRQAMIDDVLAPPEDGEDDPGAADRRRQSADALFFADVIPRIVELRVDPRDRLWVGVAESKPDSITRIDVYERDGTLLGELHDLPLPARFFGRDRAVILGRDELDVQQIKILRLVEEPEALESAGSTAGGAD